MSAAEQIREFIVFFYTTFIQPLILILKGTNVLGASLFYWVFGLTVLSIGVSFVRRFLGSDDK